MPDDTTPTPDSASDASIEAALFAQAQAQDAGQSVDTPAAADAQPTPAPEPTQSGNAPAATPTTPTPPQQQQPKPTPDQTPYGQKRTDKERLADSWKALEARKAELAAERERFYREQAELARGGKPAPTQPAADAADPLAAFSPEQLEAAAERFDQAGNFDMAAAARAEAKAKRERPPTPTTQQSAEPNAALKAAQAEWNANIAALEKTEPEFADANGTLRKETVQVLQAYPVLRSYPGGIKDAVELVRLRRTAGEAEGLRKQVDEWKKRAEQAEARLVPATGAPESSGRSKGILEMGDAEAEAELLRMAQQQDAAA